MPDTEQKVEDSELRKRRDSLNKEVKKIAGQKKAIIDQIRAIREDSKKAKDARDAENKQVAELKAQRRAVETKINEAKKKLDSFMATVRNLQEGVSDSYMELKSEFDALDWEYQTGVCSIKKEKEMVKRMDALEVQLKKSEKLHDKQKELHSMQKAIRELYTEANVFHQAIMVHAQASEGHHQKMLQCFRQMDELSKQADHLEAKIRETRTQADAVHAQIIGVKKEELAIMKREEAEFEKEMSAKNKAAENAMRAKAEKILSDFKSGKKVSLEELAILEKFGLY
jgi:uncharacterized coiled-coil DUF342 family protein